MAGCRIGLLIATAAGVAMAGVFAAPVTSGLAPIAIGEGTVIDLPPLDTAVGESEASADEEGASSKSTTVRVVGTDVGSTRAESNETKTETTVEVPVPLTSRTSSVSVAPRSASASSNTSPHTSRSESHSDVVTARIPGLVEIEVLSSDAEAVWTPGSSWSRGQVDGATLSLGDGDLVIVLMHAEESSDGRQRLYLIRINDATYFETGVDEPLRLEVPDIFTIELAATEASGGFFTGEVVEAEPVDETNFDEFEDVMESASEEPIESEEVEFTSALDDESGLSDAGRSATLPITGTRIMLLILFALTLILVGLAMSATGWLIAPERA